MISKNRTKIIIIGAVLFLLLTSIGGAEETKKDLPSVHTTTAETDAETQIRQEDTTVIHHNADDGEHGDIESLPLPEDDTTIGIEYPYEENLVQPGSDADGDVFILELGSQTENKDELTDTTQENLLGFPLFAGCVVIGLLGCIYIYGRKQG